MKFIKYLIPIIFLLAVSISCKEKGNSTVNNTEKKISKEANYQKMELQISGMTCEIGCARLIESKLAKTQGIKFSKVSFKDSLGMIEFDSNLLTKTAINNVVESIADGTLYKVTETKIVTDFSKKK